MAHVKVLITKKEFKVDGVEIGKTVHGWSYSLVFVNGEPRMQLIVNRFVYDGDRKEFLSDDTGACIFGQCFVNPDIKIEVDGGFEKSKIVLAPSTTKVK